MAGVSRTALDYAERLYRRFPNDANTLDTVGTVRLGAGDAPGALEVLTRAQAAAPTAPNIAFHLAQALAANGDTERALALLRPLLSASGPSHAQAQELVDRLEGPRREADGK